jgi:hypothetical protein
VKRVIGLLRDDPLITEAMVDEAWHPGPREVTRQADAATRLNNDPRLSKIASLADAAFEPAVRHAIEKKDITTLEAMLWLPGNDKKTLDILRTFDQITDTALSLLRLVIAEHGESIDLSRMGLSDGQVHSIIATTKNLESVTSLNVSYIPALGRDELLTVVHALPNLQRLVLYGTAVEAKDLSSFLVRPCLTDLIHPAMFASPNPVTPMFSILVCTSSYQPAIKGASTPYSTPRGVVQKMSKLIASINDSYRVEESTQSLEAILGFSPNVEAPSDWNKRSVTHRAELSEDLFRVGGWAFIILANYTDTSWAFVKLSPDETSASGDQMQPARTKLKGTLHDVKSFLAQIGHCGPPASDEEVAALESVIAKASGGSWKKAWMTESNMTSCVESLPVLREHDQMSKHMFE